MTPSGCSKERFLATTEKVESESMGMWVFSSWIVGAVGVGVGACIGVRVGAGIGADVGVGVEIGAMLTVTGAGVRCGMVVLVIFLKLLIFIATSL